MSDLREALEQIGEAWDDGNAVGLDGYVGPNRGAGDVDPEAERRRGQLLDRAAEMLADHPVEPAREEQRWLPVGSFDETIADLVRHWDDTCNGVDWIAGTPQEYAEAALMFIIPQLAEHPAPFAAEVDPETGFARPLLDREAVRDAIRDEFLWAGPAVIEQDVESAVGHVMELARPMPTEPEIVGVLHRAMREGSFAESPADRRLRQAQAVRALLNGTDQTTEE